MSTRRWPQIDWSSFIGVDWRADRQRLPAGWLSEATGVRVNRDGSLVGIGSWENVLGRTGLLDIILYDLNDELVGVHQSTTTATIYRWDRDWATETSRGTFTITSGATVGKLVNAYERVFISIWGEALHVLTDETVSKVASADTDLDSDSDSTDELPFNSIALHGGHLFGFGFGDETGTGGEETNDLGADRPEIVRWSHLGAPTKWRPENWIMVGTRGQPIYAGISAFGRLALLKPEGVFLLYGDFEQNFPQLEQLDVEPGMRVGCVGPKAACYYRDGLYWLSQDGPMRWRGGPRAEYIGRGVEGSLTVDYRNFKSAVIPVPEIECVLFWGFNEPTLPPGANIPGGPTVPPGQNFAYAWLFDTVTEQWAGQVDNNAYERECWSVVPDEYGQNKLVSVGSPGVQAYLTDASNDVPMGSEDWWVSTAELPLSGDKGGVLRGVLFEGDWVHFTPGRFTVRIRVDDALAKTTEFWVRTSAPTAAGSDDVWYDTANDYAMEWNGSAWVRQPGVPTKVARIQCELDGRVAYVSLEVTGSQTAGIDCAIRKMALQVRPR